MSIRAVKNNAARKRAILKTVPINMAKWNGATRNRIVRKSSGKKKVRWNEFMRNRVKTLKLGLGKFVKE